MSSKERGCADFDPPVAKRAAPWKSRGLAKRCSPNDDGVPARVDPASLLPMLLKPVHDVKDLGRLVARTATHSVSLSWKPHQHRFHLPQFKSGVILLSLRDRRAEVVFSRRKQSRRRDLVDIGQHRPLHILLRLLPRRP